MQTVLSTRSSSKQNSWNSSITFSCTDVNSKISRYLLPMAKPSHSRLESASASTQNHVNTKRVDTVRLKQSGIALNITNSFKASIECITAVIKCYNSSHKQVLYLYQLDDQNVEPFYEILESLLIEKQQNCRRNIAQYCASCCWCLYHYTYPNHLFYSS